MPLYLRRILPENLGRFQEKDENGQDYKMVPGQVTSQEEAANLCLSNIIRQFASLSKQANDIFGKLPIKI